MTRPFQEPYPSQGRPDQARVLWEDGGTTEVACRRFQAQASDGWSSSDFGPSVCLFFCLNSYRNKTWKRFLPQAVHSFLIFVNIGIRLLLGVLDARGSRALHLGCHGTSVGLSWQDNGPNPEQLPAGQPATNS